jgi:hypothetical protein
MSKHFQPEWFLTRFNFSNLYDMKLIDLYYIVRIYNYINVLTMIKIVIEN